MNITDNINKTSLDQNQAIGTCKESEEEKDSGGIVWYVLHDSTRKQVTIVLCKYHANALDNKCLYKEWSSINKIKGKCLDKTQRFENFKMKTWVLLTLAFVFLSTFTLCADPPPLSKCWCYNGLSLSVNNTPTTHPTHYLRGSPGMAVGWQIHT